MLYIFDWDGTLMDSTDKIIGCMQEAAATLGLDNRSENDIREIIGLGLPEAIKVLYPTITPSLSEALRQRYSEVFVKADQLPCPFYPGVEEVLATLRAEGHQLAIATGKSRRGLSRVMENLGLSAYFDATRCADETCSKPDPLMLEELLEELSVSVVDAVMIGDTEFDMAMAKTLGMARIAVSYGAHEKERLATFEPELCLDHFSQLLAWRRSAA